MKNMNELINLFVNNNISREKAVNIVDRAFRTAVDINDGNQKAADSYIDFIYNIVENFYITVYSLNFGRKNEMIEEIVKYINNAYTENKESIVQSKERINEFITTLIKNYNELRLNPTYERVLTSIEAFIGCENKLEIYGEEEKIINQLLANKENDLETVNNIIEAITILADEINIDVIIAIEQIMQEGLKTNKCTLKDIEMTAGAICDLLQKKEENKIDENNLQEFLSTIIDDYKMHQEGKCSIEQFLYNIQQNTRDIKAESEKNVEVVNFQVSTKNPVSTRSSINLLTNMVGSIIHSPQRIAETIGLKNASKKKKAVICTLGAMTLAGAVGVTTHHFKAPVQAERENGNEAETSEEQETEEAYFSEAETQENYNTNNEVVPENSYDLPLHIYAKTIENWGSHGPKEGTDVIVMVDSYGGIYKVKYLDENKIEREITTPNILYKYRDSLDINIDRYVEDYKNSSQELSIEQSIEPQVFTLKDDYQFDSVIPEDVDEITYEEDDVDEITYGDGETNSEIIDEIEIENSSKTTTQDENLDISDIQETEEPTADTEQITLKAGEKVFGYIIVKDGDIVVRITDKNKNPQDIPAAYFDGIKLGYDSQIEKRLFGESINYTVTQDTPVYDFTHDTFTGVIPAGETVQIDFEDAEHAVAEVNGYEIGYPDENVPALREKIEEFSNQIFTTEKVDKIVDENIPVSPVSEQYYNIIRIPKDVENENLVDIFMNASKTPQMPDTKFNENYGTIIEVDTSKGTNAVLERINTVLRITGQPCGIQCNVENEKQLTALTKLIEQIKDSENGTFLQYGVTLNIPVAEDEFVYDPFYGQTVENQDYDNRLKFINDSYKTINGMGIPVSLQKTSDDNISLDKLNTQIPLTLIVSRGQDNKYSSKDQDYKAKLDQAGFKVTALQDKASCRIALDDEQVNLATKAILQQELVQPDIPYDESSTQNDEEYTDNYESDTQSEITTEENNAQSNETIEEEIEFY